MMRIKNRYCRPCWVRDYGKLLSVACIVLLCWLGLAGNEKIIGNEKKQITLLFLQQKVLDFAHKYSSEDVIVVSKKDHLLYYCRGGQIVQNDYWNGFKYSFPVQVSLAGKYYWTPEGEMYIELKNPRSHYTRFLKLSYPYAYGIHGDAAQTDNTRGCVAVENRVIKYLFAKVDIKTPVLILP